MSTSRELPVSALYRSCDLRQLDFETTSDLDDLDHLVAQERATNAIEFGASIQHEGYNLFVLGREGTGRHSLLQQYLEKKARTELPASDWCYLNNFEESRQPKAIGLPAGRGRKLAADMNQLVDDARAAIPAAFESEDYRTRRESIERELAEEQEAAFEAVSKRAKERGIGIVQTPTGIAFAPIRGEETLDPEEFNKLPEAERQQIVRDTEEVGKELQAVMRQAPKRVREARRRVQELDREIALWAVGSLIEELTQKYEAHEEVVRYLERISEDIVQNIALFRASPEERSPLQQLFGGSMAGEDMEASPATQRYAVNVLVDHAGAEGAPVVFEQNPTFRQLSGTDRALVPDGHTGHEFPVDQGRSASQSKRRIPGARRTKAADSTLCIRRLETRPSDLASCESSRSVRRTASSARCRWTPSPSRLRSRWCWWESACSTTCSKRSIRSSPRCSR